MTIEDFFRLLLRNVVMLLVTSALGAAAGYGVSYLKTPQYQATALGFVKGVEGTGTGAAGTGGGTQQQYSKAQFYLPLFTTRAVSDRIQQETGDAPGAITTSLDPNAPIITVTADGASPDAAQKVANASIKAVAVEADKLSPGTGGQLIAYQPAVTPTAPVSPDRKKFGAIGLGVGLLIGFSLAWLRNRSDSRLRTVDDVEAAVQVPALGVLPEAKDLQRGKDGLLPEPTSFVAREALRKLRTNLRFVDVDNPPRSIVITSSAPAEGKSTVSGNLGRVMARAGQRTILIDADMRKPMQATEFGIDGGVGLSQVLAGTVTLEEAVQRVGDSRLVLLPAGQIPPNPSELVGSRRMYDLIAELSKEFFVIVDAPPVLAVTDAQLLARHTDGAILVAVPGRTRSEVLSRAVGSIHGIGARVLGVVLNRASTSRLTRLTYGDAEYGFSNYGYGKYMKKGYGYGETRLAEDPTLDEYTVDPADPVADHLEGSTAEDAVQIVEDKFDEGPDGAAPSGEAPAPVGRPTQAVAPEHTAPPEGGGARRVGRRSALRDGEQR